MSEMTTNNKVALITGASSGIGEATAMLLAARGLQVALIARREKKLQTLADKIQEEGGNAAWFVADVSRENEAHAAAQWAIETFGAVDVLINNAGIIRPGMVASQNSQEWRDTLDVNVLAPMYMAQAVLPAMKIRQSGHIVNISSNTVKIAGGLNQSSYAASKYAVTAFSSSLRKEVAEDGIRVTIIEPGTTETDVADSIPDEKARAMMYAHVHKDSVMKASDIAEAIYFALSQPERVNVSEIWITPTRG